MTNLIPIKFIYSDAGRSTSKRSKQRNDCVIRSIALAFNQSYDDIYDRMKEMGRECGRGTQKVIWQEWLNTQTKKISFPAIKGQPRMFLKKLINEYNCGIYLIHTAKHLTVCKNGIIYDTSYPDENKCVYNIWLII